MQLPSPIPLHHNKRFRRTLVGAASCDAVRSLQAGGNITARAVQVDAGGDLSAQASSLGGKTITVQAGQDLSATGSHLISDSGTTLAVQNNITITAQSIQIAEAKETGRLCPQ